MECIICITNANQGKLFFPSFPSLSLLMLFCHFSAYKSGKITTVGIGDGGNEIGMGKVHQQVIKHIQNGRNIASTVATDHLVTAGVSNWGGSALVAALRVLNRCPMHSRYARRGAGTDGVSIRKEDLLITVEMVMILVKPLMPL